MLGKSIEGPILDYLYGNFLDEPAFNAAVARALPPASKRKAVNRQREQTVKQLDKAKGEAKNLVKAIRQGARVSLLLDSQNEVDELIKAQTERLRRLDTELAEFPDEQEIKSSAMMTRLHLVWEYQNRDWRELPQTEIKRFLLNLFCDADGDAGIYLRKDDDGRLIAEFKGQVRFDHNVVDGRAISHSSSMRADRLNEALRSQYESAIAEVNRQHQRAIKRKQAIIRRGKPYTTSTCTVPVNK